jgi:hypothetical protein
MDCRRAEPMLFEGYEPKEGKKMASMNLLPEKPEAVNWRRLERSF